MGANARTRGREEGCDTGHFILTMESGENHLTLLDVMPEEAQAVKQRGLEFVLGTHDHIPLARPRAQEDLRVPSDAGVAHDVAHVMRRKHRHLSITGARAGADGGAIPAIEGLAARMLP